MRKAATRKTQRGTAVGSAYSLPAPTGGLNKRDSIAAMGEADAIEMTNMFPEASDVRVRKGIEAFATDIPDLVESLMPYNAQNGVQELYSAANGKIWDTSSRGTVLDYDFYLFGTSGTEDVNSFAMSTAGDVSTAAPKTQSFSVKAEEGVPRSMAFKADGTKLYVVGQKYRIYQYSLSTAWDIRTATKDDSTFLAETTTGFVTGPAFKSDGTKMYVQDLRGGMYQYSLSSAWDVATASFEAYYDVSADLGAPISLQGITFKTDGTKAYVTTSGKVYQFSLGTAWDITTLSYDSKSYTTSQDNKVYSVQFKSDGLSMFALGDTNDTIYQYTLSSAWDVSTATYASKSLDVSSEETSVRALFFDDTGDTAFIIGSINDSVWSYSLGTSWDISTGTANVSDISLGDLTNPWSFRFHKDGSKLYALDQFTDRIYQYALSIPWDITTAVFDSAEYGDVSDSLAPQSFVFKADGTKMYVLNNTQVVQFSLATAWDITTVSYDAVTMSVATETNTPKGLAIKADGTSIYVCCPDLDIVPQYNLSTAWDLSTGSYASKSLSTVAEDTTCTDIALTSDGAKLYMLGASNDTIYQYTLTTPWDVSTASYASKSFDISSYETVPRAIVFRTGASKVSSLTNNRWQHVNFTLSDGTSYLCAFNGADSPQYYDGLAWTSITGASSPAITGITTTDIVNAFVFKRRMYLVLNNSLSVYYLPVDSVGGAANPVGLGGIAKKGGFVMAGETWTLDAGEGVDDYWAAITSEGELIVYKGTDPSSASTWALHGVWNVGEPIGRRCMYKYQGDLLIITKTGIVSVSRIMLSGRVDDQAKVSDKISQAVSDDIELYGSNFGWQMMHLPAQDMLILNVPVTEGSSYKQYAMNTITGMWGGPFSGVTSACWAIWDESPYFGAATTVEKFWVNDDDNGSAISFNLQQAYSGLGKRGVLKLVKAVRPFVTSDGSFAMNVAINTDYSTEDVAGSVNSGDLRFTDWDAVGGIGSSISLRLKGEINGTNFKLQASDIVYEAGGIIG